MLTHPLKNLVWPVIAALVAGCLVAGCSEEEKKAAPRPIPEVAVLTVQPQRIVLTTELPARILAFRISEIRPQVSGLILKRYFTEGASVAAGDNLYQIDPTSYEAALKTARAGLERARASLPAAKSRAQRYSKLLGANAVSQQNYDDAVGALKQIEADILYGQSSVETADINLGHTLITAPIPGRIGRSSVSEGAIVTAYQAVPLATIQQLDPIYVDIMQSATQMLRLKNRVAKGRLSSNDDDLKGVRLVLEDGSPYPLEGTLKFRDVTVDQTTGSVVLRAVFPNPEKILLPGMFVRTIIKEGVKPDALLIPQQAVARDLKGNPVAYVVDQDDIVQLHKLVLERAIKDKWLVSEGVSPGDRIILEGLQKVRPGSKARTVPFNPDARPEQPARANGEN